MPTGMDKTSPRLMLYGRSIETKNGWKTCKFLGSLVKPRPVIGSNENPVMTHDVIVSGTFL